jgi:GNAT superfamily N-acetyltransferase
MGILVCLRAAGCGYLRQVDQKKVLQAFDTQVRQSTRPDGTGAVIERAGAVVRRVTDSSQDGSCVCWSGLDAASADAVIAEQVAYFRGLGTRFEWKLYSYDQPADLAQRLLDSGFVAEDPESMMLAEVASVPRVAGLPDGVRLQRVTDPAGVDLLIALHERVFGDDESGLRQSLLAQLRDAPEVTVMVLAMAGDEPVSAGRIEFVTGSEFAGLWGGGTLPQWRGRGIYRALVAYRAALAAEAGYRYLLVDASPDSRPILERLGFSCLATTTPYIWSPS